MPDILLRWDPEHGRADWLLRSDPSFGPTAPGDLANGDDLATAITVSLFTDRRAGDASGIAPDEDPRGWWADAYRDRPLGSRLWLLDRAKKTPATLRRAEDYAREALAWLVSDGVAARLDIRAAWIRSNQDTVRPGPNALGLRVLVTQPSGRQVAYEWAWKD